MAETNTHDEHIKKLAELIKDVQIAMMTTQESDGTLHSRPMGTQQVEFDGDLWFFTGASSAKVAETEKDRHVNISYAKPDDNVYVSVSGTAETVRDKAKMKELWNPIYKAWFPKGLDDPDLALMKVSVTEAEYWDSPSGVVVAIAGFVKAIATGKPAQGLGENEKISL